MPIVVVVFASATASDIERHVLIIMRPSQVTQVSSVSYCGSCAGQCRSFPSIGKTRPGMERMSWVCLGRCLAMAATVVDPRHTLSPVIHLQRRRESPFISLPNDELPIEHFRRPRSETTIKYQRFHPSMRKPLQLATSNDGDQNELTTTKPRQRAHFRFVAHGELASNYFAWTIGINWTIYVGLYTAIRHLMAVEWML